MSFIVDKKKLPYLFLGLLVVFVWGGSFISSKVLIESGMTPIPIFTLRCLVSFSLLTLFSREKFISKSWKDELMFVAMGIVGGSMYYVSENYALVFSTTTNVSFIVCMSPLLLTLLASAIYDDVKINAIFVVGSVFAVLGLFLLVFNGQISLVIYPIGDMIALLASFCWAIYCLFIKKVSSSYSSSFITLKVFFYALLTILPMAYLFRDDFHNFDYKNVKLVGNLLFLGAISSSLCFYLWNVVIKHLGAIRANYLVYLNPIFTMLFSSVLLDEDMTLYSIIGSFLILFGVILSSVKFDR